MEEIVSIPFRREERSYFSTSPGWRLATFEEARNGVEMIKEHNILEKWDRVRLLDGWILGSGYNFEMGNDFKGCLGYMLLIQTQVSGCAYADVKISDSQKQVALFLCADDWNYEVVYWLFNSWSETDSMDPQDVIQGRIPFSNPELFKEMNKKISSLARKLGDKGPVSRKAEKRRFSGKESAEDVLADLIEIVNKENLQQYSFDVFCDLDEYKESCLPWSLQVDWLDDFAEQGGEGWNNIADAIWNFLSESYAGSMVELMATLILGRLCKLNDLETKTPSKKNFIVASCILIYLSEFRTDIIHTQLAHECFQSCAVKIICHVASNYGPADLPGFNKALQNNATWRCYDQIGNYDVLNKLLVLAAAGHVSSWLQTEKNTDLLVVNRLLECGARPRSGYALLGYENLTALNAALAYVDDDNILTEVAKTLLNGCDEERHKQLEDSPNGNGQSALHLATLRGNEKNCQILLQCGAKLGVEDEDGRTALHKAVELGKDTVVDLFMNHPDIIKSVDFRDKMGESPIDTAVARNNIKLVAKLITKSEEPADYFDKLDLKQLLRYSLLNGSVGIVRDLFQKREKLLAGECDEEGKTALHLDAMCEDNRKAMDMVEMVLENVAGKGKEKLVAERDRRGRTALQEAALNGNEELCKYLLDINPKIITFKDGDGRNPIYDAAKGKQNEEDVMKMLLAVYSKKDIPVNALIDRNGLTPLHVAASLGKRELVKLLLSNEKKGKEYVKRRDLVAQETWEYLKISDFLGQTALHKAAYCGNSDTVEILLKKGAHPLEERDCDGSFALHYAVKAKIEGDKTEGDRIRLIDLLLQGCNTSEEKLLLLWASAAGLGTADQSLSSNDPLRQFLVKKRDEIKAQLDTGNLLKMAASVGDIEMTKELITRGYQMGDIQDTKWSNELTPEKRENVKRVASHLERIVEQGNDQPTVLDNLGRIDYAHGLAALLLNPYIKPPIVVGISGSWGMGKSSLMVQTESILLKTAAQMALLQSAKLSSSALELPDITTLQLSKKGEQKYEEIKRRVDFAQKDNRTLFSMVMDKIWSRAKKSKKEVSPHKSGHNEHDSLVKFLSSYQAKYRKFLNHLLQWIAGTCLQPKPNKIKNFKLHNQSLCGEW